MLHIGIGVVARQRVNRRAIIKPTHSYVDLSPAGNDPAAFAVRGGGNNRCRHSG